ncbi:hypothetical protein LCGC14_0564980 [marine sediment metagenome]|uniref:Uncharacterized protein n=1 Tax=marine sediment metagenome TaxID=412755 RepID=A0A0F9RKQ9_9ZZZZ
MDYPPVPGRLGHPLNFQWLSRRFSEKQVLRIMDARPTTDEKRVGHPSNLDYIKLGIEFLNVLCKEPYCKWTGIDSPPKLIERLVSLFPKRPGVREKTNEKILTGCSSCRCPRCYWLRSNDLVRDRTLGHENDIRGTR